MALDMAVTFAEPHLQTDLPPHLMEATPWLWSRVRAGLKLMVRGKVGNGVSVGWGYD